MAKIIIQRITDALDKQLREEQAGFRKGRECIDQIFVNFVDFQKAFDSINRKT